MRRPVAIPLVPFRRAFSLAGPGLFALSSVLGGCGADLAEDDAAETSDASQKSSPSEDGPDKDASTGDSGEEPDPSPKESGDTSPEDTSSEGEPSPKDPDAESKKDDSDPDADCPKEPPPGPDCDATDIAGKLKCIPGMTVSSEGSGKFSLTLEQPLDHENPSGTKFKHRISLKHVSFDAPLIVKNSGYHRSGASHELTRYFDANVIAIEHRFFGPSKPKGEYQWEYLTMKQDADDFHEIYKALKWIYPKAWVNTGASKGGETVVFHRRFHHCDVDATVSYVAPFVLGTSDPRFNTYLNELGGDELKSCRARLKSVQRTVLENKDTFLKNLKDSEYPVLGGAEISLEHAIMEFPFAFFQSGKASQCSKVPGLDASAQEKYRYLNKVMPVADFKDSGVGSMRPYYMQAAMELGWPGTLWEDLEDLLKFKDTYNANAYMPKELKRPLDEKAIPDVLDWLSRKGRRIIFIYGAYDPWSAAMAELGDAKDCYRYIVPKTSHNASLRRMSAKNRKEALDKLGEWLDVPIKNAYHAPELVDDPELDAHMFAPTHRIGLR